MKLQSLWTSLIGIFLFIAWGLSSPNSALAAKSPCRLHFKKAKICAAFDWVKKPGTSEMPTEKDMGAFDLHFFRKGAPIQKPLPYDVSPRIFMPMMDHGSMPTQVSVSIKDPSLYHVTHVFLSMEGKWQIWIQLFKGDKLVDKSKIDYVRD